MRRIALTLSLLATVACVALIAGASAHGGDTYTFDVIFDDARGLVGGQIVKIAGARAGTISKVLVTPADKARIVATVPGRFAMHTDATCTIRPQGLVAENYVECDPGRADAPLLRAAGGHPPTVPVTHTTEPVELTDLFNIFDLPTRERLQVLLDELGIATAGEGDGLNDVLRRANPALAQARRVIAILQRQQAQLVTIVDATGAIAAQGATHTAAVRDFISRASALTAQTADHAAPLSQAINRLPALLSAAQPALNQLDTVARDGTPLLANLDAAVPSLNRVDSDIAPFTAVARPALRKIASAIRVSIPAIRDVTPMVRAIHSYLDRSAANTALFSKLSINLQAHGFPENFLSVAYYVAASLSRYDGVSHMLALLLIGPGSGKCGNYDAGAPIPACSAHYGQQPAYTPEKGPRRPARASSNPAQRSLQGLADYLLR